MFSHRILKFSHTKNVCYICVLLCVCVWSKTPLSVPGSQSTTSTVSLNFSSCLRHIFVLFATANTVRQYISQNCLVIPSPHLPSPWRDTKITDVFHHTCICMCSGNANTKQYGHCMYFLHQVNSSALVLLLMRDIN